MCKMHVKRQNPSLCPFVLPKWQSACMADFSACAEGGLASGCLLFNSTVVLYPWSFSDRTRAVLRPLTVTEDRESEPILCFIS